MKWSRNFGADLLVSGKKFKLTLPLNHPLTITSIHYTKIGNWIELRGTMDAPVISSIGVIDGSKTNCRACSCASRTTKGKEETGAQTETSTRSSEFIQDNTWDGNRLI